MISKDQKENIICTIDECRETFTAATQHNTVPQVEEDIRRPVFATVPQVEENIRLPIFNAVPMWRRI